MKNEWNHSQILKGSFSAVWIATIASKVTFYSIFQALQDKQTFAPLTFQIFQIFAHFWWFLQIFSKCCWKFTEIADFSVKSSLIFVGISGNCRQLPEITILCTNFSKFARKWCKSSSIFDEQIHQFIKIWWWTAIHQQLSRPPSPAPGTGEPAGQRAEQQTGGAPPGRWGPGLKDPIGERSDKSNFWYKNSVKIMPEFEKICLAARMH